MKKGETKKPAMQSQTGTQEAPLAGKKFSDFIGDMKAEFAKISWTSQDELKLYTKIVVGTTVVFGLGTYVVDLIIRTALGTLGTFVKAIFG